MGLSTLIIALKVGPLLLFAGYAFTFLVAASDRRLFRERGMWMMPGLFYLALITPWLPFFLILVVALLPLVARTRGEAAALFLIALAGLPPIRQSLSVGDLHLVETSVLEALGLSFLIASFVCRGRSRVNWGWRDLPIAIFIVLNVIAQGRGVSFTAFLRETLSIFVAYGIPYIAFRRSITTVSDVRMVLLAICFAAGVQSVLAVYEMLSVWPVYNTLFDHFGIPIDFTRWIKIRGGLMRAHGAFPESTSFGWFLAVAITATIAARRNFPSWLHWGAAMFVLMLGMYATGARIGLLAVAMGLVAIDLSRRNYGAVFRSAVIASLGYASLYGVAATTGLFRNIVGLGSDGASTLEYRKLLFNRGLEEFWHHPLAGASLADVKVALADLEQGEHIIDFVNAYVYFGLTSGVFGVIAFVMMFLLAMAGAWRNRGASPLPDKAAAMQLASTCFAVSAFSMVTAFTSGFAGAPLVFFFALLAGNAALPAMRKAEPRRAPARPARPLVTGLGRPTTS